MNYTKIATALRALADALVDGAEEPAETKPKGKQKAAPATASALAAPTAAAAEPAPADLPPPPPPLPSVTKDQLKGVILKLAAKSRDRAEAALNAFGAANLNGVPPEKYQAAYDLFEEEIAKIDAAAVQVAQASLV